MPGAGCQRQALHPILGSIRTATRPVCTLLQASSA
jgi:hypothetical protein